MQRWGPRPQRSFASTLGAGRPARFPGRGRIQGRRCAHERLERTFVELITLVDIDGASRVAFEAAVEEPRGVVERGALHEGQLHDARVGLASADDSVV